MIPLFCVVKIGVPGTGHIIKWNGALYDIFLFRSKKWRTDHRSHHKVESGHTMSACMHLLFSHARFVADTTFTAARRNRIPSQSNPNGSQTVPIPNPCESKSIPKSPNIFQSRPRPARSRSSRTPEQHQTDLNQPEADTTQPKKRPNHAQNKPLPSQPKSKGNPARPTACVKQH